MWSQLFASVFLKERFTWADGAATVLVAGGATIAAVFGAGGAGEYLFTYSCIRVRSLNVPMTIHTLYPVFACPHHSAHVSSHVITFYIVYSAVLIM